MTRREWVALVLILSFVGTRGLFGAMINPPFNGPDERGHLTEIAVIIHPDVTSLERVSQRQPTLYYVAGASFIRLLEIPVDPANLGWRLLFPLRLASVLLGVLTTGAAYFTARYAFRGDSALSLATALVAGLTPVHQFIMASAANDPLAILLAAVSIAVATRILTDGWSRMRAIILFGSSLAAVATKSTGLGAAIVVTTFGLIAICQFRHFSLSPRWLVVASMVTLLIISVVIGFTVWIAPGSFFVTHQLPFLLPAAWHLPANFLLTPGGLSETFRTFWVQPDYAVSPSVATTLAAVLLMSLALIGGMRSALFRSSSPLDRGPVILLVGFVATQLLLISYRYSLGLEKDVLLGGATQAKFMLPVLPAIAVLIASGWAGLLRPTQRRWLPMLVLLAMLVLDVAALLPFIWKHYKWLEMGLPV